jgi:hypothetical protein
MMHEASNFARSVPYAETRSWLSFVLKYDPTLTTKLMSLLSQMNQPGQM